MKIFDKRPLSMILCIALMSFVIFSFLSLVAKFLLISALIFASTLLFIFKKKRFSTSLIRISVIVALVFSIFSYLYFDVYYLAYERYDDYVEIIGTVTDLEGADYNKTIDIKTKSIDDEPFSNYKLRAYLDFDESMNISRGSVVKIRGKIERFSNNADFDTNSYYLSKGYSGQITDLQSIEYLGNSQNKLDDFLANVRTYIKIEFAAKTDNEVCGLMSALFIGDKDDLSPQIPLDFKRIGISHILALSGMHLSILILGLSKLLALLGINKKLRSVFIISATVFYVALTGFSTSVLRAGLMLIIAYLLYLLKYKQDSLTSLFIAVSIIVLFEPYAALSISLWLSALATLGILSLSSDKFKERPKRSFKKIILSLSISLFAVYSTLLISNVCFDGITYLSAITTLIFAPFVEILLFAAIPLILLPSISPFSAFVNLVGNFIIDLSAKISNFEYSYSSDDYLLIRILVIIFTVLFALFLVLKIKRKVTYISLLFAFYLVIQLSAVILSYSSNNTENFDYIKSEECELIYIANNGEKTLIAIDDYDYKSYLDAKEAISDYKLTSVDNYLLTSYSNSLAHHLTLLLNSVKIRAVYLPMPQNANDSDICDKILKSLEYYRAEIIFYEPHKAVKFGDYAFVLSKNTPVNTSDKNELLFTVIKDGELYTYLTANVFDSEYREIAKELISESETLIIGSLDTGEYRFTFKAPNIEKLIISNKKLLMGDDVYAFYTYKNMHFYPDKIELDN